MAEEDLDEKDRLLLDVSELLYDGNIYEVKNDIWDYMNSNCNRLGIKKRQILNDDTKRLERLCLMRTCDDFIEGLCK